MFQWTHHLDECKLSCAQFAQGTKQITYSNFNLKIDLIEHIQALKKKQQLKLDKILNPTRLYFNSILCI
jgi:hypothetical protein